MTGLLCPSRRVRRSRCRCLERLEQLGLQILKRTPMGQNSDGTFSSGARRLVELRRDVDAISRPTSRFPSRRELAGVDGHLFSRHGHVGWCGRRTDRLEVAHMEFVGQLLVQHLIRQIQRL
eukprot:scaffold22309_cov116-Isochrysis_galbana.AAC.4